jgi:glycosyltransferase involved in cell wall biosynthesis
VSSGADKLPGILHLIPTLEGGGAERQLVMLATEQKRRGWDVHIALRRGGVHEKQVRNVGIPVHFLGDFKGFHPMLLVRISALLRRLKPQIVQTWLPQMDIAGGTMAVLCSASREAYRALETVTCIRRILARFANAVVANSPEGAKYWRCVVRVDRVVTILNAVDTSTVLAAAPMTFETAPDSGKTLLFVGRLAMQKAPDLLIRAIRDIPPHNEIRALMIGDGPLRAAVLKSISSFNLEERVKVLPYLPNWWGLLKTCTALVSMSRFEGQPNVVLEAMAAECPLIVSDIPAHRAILDEESALIVPGEDTTAWANAIMSIVSDPERARQRAERAARRVASFTIASTADGYDRVYAKVLQRREN